MKRILNRLIFGFTLTLAITSCATPTPTVSLPVATVFSTSSAAPWLADLYDCARDSAILVRVDDPNTADIALEVGEPEFLSSFAYQFDEEEILVVTHRQSPIQNMDLEGVRALFMGQGDPSVQIWVYPSDMDVQKAFDQFVMESRNVTPSALIAANPQQMSDVLVNQPNTVGILPRHWKAGDVRDVFSVAKVPVLALTQSEPQGVVNNLIGCLQSK